MNLTERPSYEMFKRLVEKNPYRKQYSMSPSLIKYLAERTKEFAKEKGIKIVPADTHPGQPRKYTDAERQKIIESDKTSKEISIRTGIPLRTVYFIKAGN